ncbi:MFS transporter [Acidiplasma sp.]|uniref:MFS transporter n=1 Tax=Acidiplasma sp. TaxID=1872114 RepID=UPI002589F87E|nr:MFS transporter [Acidiplasma sp.]
MIEKNVTFKSYKNEDFTNALKISVSANLGWGFELFDLVVYLYVTTTIAPLFFPSSSYIASVLLFLGTLVLGYFARPIGAVFLGHFGDKIGRKSIWLVSLLGMGIATVSMGFLPTYAQVGVLATVLLIALRMSQGFFLAGEWGGGQTIVNENSPQGLRGFFSGIQQGGAALGLIFAVIANEIALYIAPGAAFSTIGWRIMFWFGAIPLAIAILTRYKIRERIVFNAEKTVKFPIVDVFKKYYKFVIVGTLLLLGNGIIYYGEIAYMPTYLGLYTKLSAASIDLAVLVTNLVWLFSSPIAGYLSDRVRSRRAWISSIFIVMIILAYPVILLLHSGYLPFVLFSGIILGLIISFQYAVIPAFLSENSDSSVRYSFIAFSINLGVALSSFGPFLGTYLSTVMKNSVLGIVILVIASSLAGFIAMMFSPRDNIDAELN